MTNRKKNWWRREQTAQLVKLYPTGMSCEDIGRIVGKSANSVASKASRMKLVHPRTEDRAWTREQAQQKAAEEREMQLRHAKPSKAKPSLAPIPQPKGTSNE